MSQAKGIMCSSAETIESEGSDTYLKPNEWDRVEGAACSEFITDNNGDVLEFFFSKRSPGDMQ
jgi:hypothetical protein